MYLQHLFNSFNTQEALKLSVNGSANVCTEIHNDVRRNIMQIVCICVAMRASSRLIFNAQEFIGEYRSDNRQLIFATYMYH